MFLLKSVISGWLKDGCDCNGDSSLGNRGVEFHCGTTSSFWDLEGLEVEFKSGCGEDGLFDFDEPLGEGGISDSVFNEEGFVDPKETEGSLQSFRAFDVTTEVEFWVDSDGDFTFCSGDTSVDFDDLDPVNEESIGVEVNVDGDDWGEVVTGLVDSSEWDGHFKEALIHDLFIEVGGASSASGFEVV